jgi:hypothetical protein
VYQRRAVAVLQKFHFPRLERPRCCHPDPLEAFVAVFLSGSRPDPRLTLSKGLLFAVLPRMPLSAPNDGSARLKKTHSFDPGVSAQPPLKFCTVEKAQSTGFDKHKSTQTFFRGTVKIDLHTYTLSLYIYASAAAAL